MIVNLKTIKDLVEVETQIKDISVSTRDQRHVDARVLYYVLAKERAKVGYAKMSNFVNRTHATAIHSYKVIYDEWKTFPKAYSENLATLDRLFEIVDKDLVTLKSEGSIKKLFMRYKRRNTLLYKENNSLREDVDRLTREVERLKKYEPIW